MSVSGRLLKSRTQRSLLPILTYPLSLNSLLVSTAAELSVQPDGAIGLGAFCDASGRRMQANIWHNVCFTVNCMEGALGCFIDGQQVSVIPAGLGLTELLPDGPLAIDPSVGLYLFASSEDMAMNGGEVRSCTLYQRELQPSEVADLYEIQRAERSWSCDTCTARNNADDQICRVCNAPRPKPKEGAQLPGHVKAPSKQANSEVAQLMNMFAEMGMHVPQSEVEKAVRAVGANPEDVFQYIEHGGHDEEDGGSGGAGFGRGAGIGGGRGMGGGNMMYEE